MKGTKILFLASWVILFVVMAATALLSMQSLRIAYTVPQDNIARDYSLTQVQQQSGDEAVKAIRSRRATAATWALGYALLGLLVVIVPYRRGEKWAWWAILLSLGLSQLLSLARLPMLETRQGTGTAAILLGLTAAALLAGAGHFFKREAVATVE